MSCKVFLALGSNLGNKQENLKLAVEYISGITKTKLNKASEIYITNPVGYLDQENFLNMVVSIETDLEPIILLKELQGIENILKRSREIHWGPRTMDIDILLFGEEVINSDELTIPHPRMFERAFVLIPLKDVISEDEIQGRNIDELIDKCEDKNGIRYFN